MKRIYPSQHLLFSSVSWLCHHDKVYKVVYVTTHPSLQMIMNLSLTLVKQKMNRINGKNVYEHCSTATLQFGSNSITFYIWILKFSLFIRSLWLWSFLRVQGMFVSKLKTFPQSVSDPLCWQWDSWFDRHMNGKTYSSFGFVWNENQLVACNELSNRWILRVMTTFPSDIVLCWSEWNLWLWAQQFISVSCSNASSEPTTFW